MLETIISGVGLGIVLSFVTGPVFFALLKTSIERGFHAGMWLAAGVVLSDFIYVGLALYGSSFIKFENEYRLPIGITGSVVLMGIGCYYLFKKVKINYDNTTSTKRNTGYFIKGFLMCIFNPSLLLYWVSVTSGIISVTGEIQAQQVIPFFGSILATQFSMDTLKAYYANKLRYRIKENTITLLNRVAGTLIIIFALKLIYNLVFNMPLV
ncbi:threonine/homoserine/homoserine lactone efflux protein [Arcticibacter tournemirensis]|uniref:LysE family translocator n=1 Tax=Arcticibacter tournemirensis TaxID=699437 RepID=A0A5M9HF93_9SPHI|nr:LysE family translocator [Arcticibacter tournemirensis]KAA8483557.1 LysE family translocator [Arcticibacter tournemirensis]TQM51494.1 threonine/homoserine/homoserine lactone efflux protein [Arcticibacter tournemirensis]